ncbi:hypothetical protein HU200_042748 [Digitaria exilis]|uniref:Cytochrome P450 n=1 Tax=Digitaria exilis TaxID=1010633 RepID=A0A835EI78_9POAL|nr:hypothetical protein HU200_042748 [Digitaria exilis]
MLLLLCSIVLPLLLLVIISNNHNGHSSLPRAPWPRLPLIGNLFFLHHTPTVASLTDVLRRLHAVHGPVQASHLHRLPWHRALVNMGSTFAHRPTSWYTGLNSHGVNSATYGSRWGRLRRNLCSHLAGEHVAGVLRSSSGRLVKNLESAAGKNGGDVVTPSGTFRHAVFGFFAALCFGEGVEEDKLGSLRGLHAEIISLIVELDAFNLVPVFVQVVCYFPRWRKLMRAQRRHHVLVTDIISARRRRREEGVGCDVAEPRCYVDTLLGLGLGEDEMVSLCWEYMNASVKTTTTALEWIMARLVLHQQKLRDDIARQASGDHTCGERRRRPFVEAVVLEALRLHPPAHYLLAHTTDKDVTLDKHVIPKGSIVNFDVASIGRDATLWAEPSVFRPDRFMGGGEGFDVHCTTGCGGGGGPETMKMIPFGAGRRVCPGAGSFVEELVRRFKWIPVDSKVGTDVDMTEKPGIITEMRRWNPKGYFGCTGLISPGKK